MPESDASDVRDGRVVAAVALMGIHVRGQLVVRVRVEPVGLDDHEHTGVLALPVRDVVVNGNRPWLGPPGGARLRERGAQPLLHEAKLSKASADSHTSTTSKPSSVSPATCEIKPGTWATLETPIVSFACSYCSTVTPGRSMIIITGTLFLEVDSGARIL
jgi:hypothetical protein